MQVTFYSDFVCPFCFIAEQSTLKRLQSEYEFELVWKGFELHPETPRGGIELTRMFGAGRYEAMAQRVRGLAEEFGIRDLAGPPRISNTRRALAVAELARDEGCLDDFRDAVSKAYWRDGADLEDLDLLTAVAESVGLAGQAATEAADDIDLQRRIDATRLEGMRRRVTGVPTFFFDDYPGSGVPAIRDYDPGRRLRRVAASQLVEGGYSLVAARPAERLSLPPRSSRWLRPFGAV